MQKIPKPRRGDRLTRLAFSHRLVFSAAPPGLGVLFLRFPGAHAPRYSLSPLRGSVFREAVLDKCGSRWWMQPAASYRHVPGIEPITAPPLIPLNDVGRADGSRVVCRDWSGFPRDRPAVDHAPGFGADAGRVRRCRRSREEIVGILEPNILCRYSISSWSVECLPANDTGYTGVARGCKRVLAQ